MNILKNEIDLLKDKTILTTSATFGQLRKELIKNLGVKRAKGFLLRNGWHLAESHTQRINVGRKRYFEVSGQSIISTFRDRTN